MIGNEKVNSKKYWDERFFIDWEQNNGHLQSEFFAKVTIELLPSWLIEQIKQKSMTIADWGCAQGDGTNVWASIVSTNQLVGIDFSTVAIKQASKRYPNIRFKNEDWLNSEVEQTGMYDFVFSSNTLEHFTNPYNVLDILCNHAREAVILMLPFKDHTKMEEHQFSFNPENVPLFLENKFRLVWARDIDCRKIADSKWPGHQVLLIYAAPDWSFEFESSLREVQLEEFQSDANLENCMQIVSERDQQIADIINSNSWKVTAPMRILLEKLKQVKHSLYVIRKVIIRKGGFIRTAESVFQIFRFEGINSLKLRAKFVQNQLLKKSANESKNLTWENFEKQILRFHENYKGVYILEATVDWHITLYQRPQQISVALGQLGYLVIYKTRNVGGDNIEGFTEVSTNVWLTNKAEVDTIKDAVHAFYSTSFAHTPESLLKSALKGTLVYEYIDHIDPEISGDKENIRKLYVLKEFAFNGGVSFIVTSAKRLYDEAFKAVGKDKVLYIPNGVDANHYRDSTHSIESLPNSFYTFRRKYKIVVGYFGAIGQWLWFSLISQMIKKRTDLGFVFIGPDYKNGVKHLPRSNNVLYLGPVEYSKLPSYAKQFDICFIPFKPGDIAASTSPLKLFEYFALEKPVVVTSDMIECVAFPEVFHGNSVETLINAIDQAVLVKDDLEFKARLAKLADENSWEVRAKQMERIFPKNKTSMSSQNSVQL